MRGRRGDTLVPRQRFLADFLLPGVRYRTEGEGDGDGDGAGEGEGGGASGAQGGSGSGGSQGGSGETSTLSVEDARKVRSENRNLRQRLKDAEKERDDLKQGTQSDIEKATGQVETLTSRNKDLETKNRDLRAQVAAARVGIVDPEIAASLVDWESADSDEDLEKQMRGILKKRPYLGGNVAGGADGGSRGGGSGEGGEDTTDMNTLLRRRAGVIT